MEGRFAQLSTRQSGTTWATAARICRLASAQGASTVQPAAASAVMGGAAFGVYRAVFLFTKSNGISTILAVFAAILVYGLLLIKLGCLEPEELQRIPGGTRLLSMFRRLRLM